MPERAPAILEVLLGARACPADPAARWFPVAFPFLFGALWIGLLTLLAWLGGHMALLARFPPVEEAEEERFSWASGKVRWVGFNNALHVGIGRRGLHLALNGLFRPVFSRGIPCIPWQELRLVESGVRGPMGLLSGTRLEVPALGMRVVLYGRAGSAVARRLSGRSPPHPGPPPRLAPGERER
jgi:hypothetical protein